MFTECLQNLPKEFAAYRPCPPAAERGAWERVPKNLRERYIMRGERLLGNDYGVITATDYMEFCKSGDRFIFEQTKYFPRRRALADLVMAECSEYEGRFIDDIINGIFAMLGEVGWQLPAHNSYIRDTPTLPLPDMQSPVIDLFAAETGALLSMAAYLLKDKLDAVSPAICVNIEAAVNEHIVAPYLTQHFWWMGDGDVPMCNWTSWCTQNCLLCVFLTKQPLDIRTAAVKKAAYSLDCFLKDYGDDGCCNEGAQYYSHAGLALFGAMEILSAAALPAFNMLWREKKIKNVAAYIYNMNVAPDYYINFADCSPHAGLRGAREYLFAKRTANEDMRLFAAADFKRGLAQNDDNSDIARINLYYLALEAFCAADILAETQAPAQPADIYYDSVGVLIARKGRYAFAAKAGGNGDSHNHNDTGSVTLYKNGEPFLIDVGVETYCKKTFSPQRYEIWTMQSAWHNLPTFDSAMQHDGAQFCASDVETSLEADKAEIKMQLAGAYGEEAHLTSFIRRAALTFDGFEMKDECCGSYKNAVLTLMLREKPQIDGDIIKVGDLGEIKITGASGEITTETVPITDLRLRTAWPDTIYRLQVPFDGEIEVSAE